MYSLDSCTFRLLYQRNVHVVNNVKATPRKHLYLSIIVLYEAFGGRLANINKAFGNKSNQSADLIAKACADFIETLELVNSFNLIPYEKEDELEFQRLSPAIKRVGPLDCRIGVQAHRRGLIVATQNVADFEAAGVECVDWSLNPNVD